MAKQDEEPRFIRELRALDHYVGLLWGDEWTPEEQKALREESQAPLSINRICQGQNGEKRGIRR